LDALDVLAFLTLACLASLGPILRHLSEQYFTASQFLAHALRHTMGRPQDWQIFCGSDDLLPLNCVFSMFVLQKD
jgi:hypothetical protein